mgnify:FL=1
MLEGKNIEFKRQYTDDIKYAVLAFANTEGGTLYIGINDDGSVEGVEDPDAVMLQVMNMIRDAIRPDITVAVDCSTELMENKHVVVLIIQRGVARPYYLANKGIRPAGVYVRQGASSVPASETAILQMIKESSGDVYEEARSLNQNLTFKEAEAYFAKKHLQFGDAQKRTLQLISADGTYSNLGMLLSDQCISIIKLAVFEGSKKTVFHDRKELSGSLFKQLEDAYAYINQFNYTRSEFPGLERVDTRDYPPEAVREALLNAVIHREYGIGGPTLISIFDDRIEFVTIGGLVKGLSLADIKLGVSMLRNKNLANVFYRLHLIEAYGTGLLKIDECYADCVVKPQLLVTDNAFKLLLPNINFAAKQVKNFPLADEIKTAAKKEERYQIVLELARKNSLVTRSMIEKALHVSTSTAVLVLKKMLQLGLLKKYGEGRNVSYSLAC